MGGMREINAEELLEAVLPTILLYSEYVQAMQPVARVALKGDESENLALRVLTDADLIFQEGIARELLKIQKEKGLGIVFLPEEESPYNNHFPKEGRIKFGLDPIDGTLVYANGHKTFCHVASVFQDDRLEGALVHTPIDRRIYCRTKNETKLLKYKNGMIKRQRFCISEGNNIALSLDVPEDVEKELRDHGINVMLFGTERIGEEIEINSIFRGEIGAFFKHHAAYVDWGPLGFIAEGSSAKVTDFQGNKIEHKYWRRSNIPEGTIPSIIVTTNPWMHEKLVETLGRYYVK